ncbi:MAG: hypothetical protein Q4F57_03340 [Weeksellaceae bacterium]|nr:hypothetical protein [Weeksellaceae bacterium]
MKTRDIKLKNLPGMVIALVVMMAGISSCTVTQTAATEADGIYYNPATAPQPQSRVVVSDQPYGQTPQEYQYQRQNQHVDDIPVRIGGRYFGDNNQAPHAYSNDTIYVDSHGYGPVDDHIQWGEYAGTTVNIYHDPWMMGMGYGMGWGWNRWGMMNPWMMGPRWGWGMGMGWGMGWAHWGYSPWMYGGMWSPWGMGWGMHPFGWGMGYGMGWGGFYGGHMLGGYYGNPYIRQAYAGRGNQNAVMANNQAMQSQALRRDGGQVSQSGSAPARVSGTTPQIRRRTADDIRATQGAVRQQTTPTRQSGVVAPRRTIPGTTTQSTRQMPPTRATMPAPRSSTQQPRMNQPTRSTMPSSPTRMSAPSMRGGSMGSPGGGGAMRSGGGGGIRR